MALNAKGNALRLAVSGTPDRSKLENRYGTLKFLFPEVYTNREHWLRTNFDMTSRTIYLSGGRTKTMIIPQSLKSPEQWVSRDKLYLIRRTKAEIQLGRPPKQYIPVHLDMNKPQYVAYTKYLNEFLRSQQAADGKIPPSVYALRARQMAISSGWDFDNNDIGNSFSSSKLDWIIEWLLERSYDDPEFHSAQPSKVVIASSFTASLRWIQRELAKLGIRAEILDGSVSGTDRSRIQHEFQQHDSSLRVVLLSMTMGVGIDLDAADDMIFLDLPYSPDEAEQVEDRIDRLSRQHRMTVWWLMSAGTIDLAIAEKNSDRYQITRSLLDGSRGITTARQVLETIRSKSV
jgi:SNF2 family DNA or RNA helicase